MTLAIVLTAVLAASPTPSADADLASPRGAAKAYLSALLAGDADGALAMVAPCSEDARQAVAGSAAIYGALRRLHRTLDGAVPGVRPADGADEQRLQLQRVDTAWLVWNGGRAELRFATGEPVLLRHTADGWRVEVRDRRAGGLSGADLLRLGRAFERAAGDAAAGLQGGAVSALLDGVVRARALAVEAQVVAL
jgi:hypothetical protein